MVEPPSQKERLPNILIDGITLTIIVVETLARQPYWSVTVTVYVMLAAGLTDVWADV